MDALLGSALVDALIDSADRLLALALRRARRCVDGPDAHAESQVAEQAHAACLAAIHAYQIACDDSDVTDAHRLDCPHSERLVHDLGGLCAPCQRFNQAAKVMGHAFAALQILTEPVP